MKKSIFGIFDDEKLLLQATKNVRAKDYEIVDAYTPFPVHGLEDAMGLPRPRMARACFLYGLIGLVVALAFQMWTFGSDWKLNIGGKSAFAIPAIIPITFEIMVLFAALGTVLTLFIRCGLWPKLSDSKLPAGITNDRFVLEVVAVQEQEDAVQDLLRSSGADEIICGDVAVVVAAEQEAAR